MVIPGYSSMAMWQFMSARAALLLCTGTAKQAPHAVNAAARTVSAHSPCMSVQEAITSGSQRVGSYFSRHPAAQRLWTQHAPLLRQLKMRSPRPHTMKNAAPTTAMHEAIACARYHPPACVAPPAASSR